jgi:hypothetical protein
LHDKHTAAGAVRKKGKAIAITRLMVGVLLGVNLIAPVLAKEDNICLQNDWLWGWQAVNASVRIVSLRASEV